MPRLPSYSSDLPPSYWDTWPSNRDLKPQPRFWISAKKLKELAAKVEFNNSRELAWAESILSTRARLGAVGSARLGHMVKNYPSAAEHGQLLANAIVDWLEKVLILGLFMAEDFPVQDPRISPVLVVPKPSRHGRVVVDLSSPHLPDLDINGDSLISVNAGINKDYYPCGGANTSDVLRRLYLYGPGCYFTKQDWSDAYKVSSVMYVVKILTNKIYYI